MTDETIRTIYKLILEASETNVKEIERILESLKEINEKDRRRILRVMRRNIRKWRRICLELTGVPLEGFGKFMHFIARKRRLAAMKATGIPIWRRKGWSSQEAWRAYQREYMRKYRKYRGTHAKGLRAKKSRSAGKNLVISKVRSS